MNGSKWHVSEGHIGKMPVTLTVLKAEAGDRAEQAPRKNVGTCLSD